MAKKSLGQLLEDASILQKAAKLTNRFGELNHTILQILREHLNQVQVRFAPNRPHNWDNHLAVLEVVYGGFILKIPVPELKLLDSGVAKKVRIKMKLKRMSVQEIAQSIDVHVKYVQAAYNFRNHRWNTTWVPGPEVYRVFDTVGYGAYRAYTLVEGEKIWKKGSHLTQVEQLSIEKAIKAVQDYEDGRVQAIDEIASTDGYRGVVGQLLQELDLDIDTLKEKLFLNHGGTLNTGNGISVSEVKEWEEANAVVFTNAAGIIVAAFDGITQVTSFWSGTGLGNQSSVREWTVGNNINKDLRRTPTYR